MSKSRASKKNPSPGKLVKNTNALTSSDPGSSNPSEMKTSEIRDLIDFISKTGLNEVDIETKELKLHVKREPDQKVFKSTPVVAASHLATPAQPLTAASQPLAKAEKSGAESAGKKTVEIKSPMIGTFYRSSGPDAGPFVSVGDKISKGQTVCIIEAMKLFNEIESEVSGTLVKVMVENATPVEYDQVLFVVEPD
jgi:acetyl-CoA carboxylase biotin carboxyl carrier protein